MTNLSLQVIEQQGQRVLTTTQLAEAFGTEAVIISNNFNRNKDRYTEGKHFFTLEGKAKRDFLNYHQFDISLKKAKIVYLWTEKGACLNAKSLQTDQAWQAYEMLVDEYYRLKEQTSEATFEGRIIPKNYMEALDALVQTEKMRLELVAKVEANAPKVEAFDTFIESHAWQTIAEVAKSLNDGRNRVYQILREEGILIKNGFDKNLPLQKYIDCGYFAVKEYTFWNNGQLMTKCRTLVSPKGLEFTRKILKRRSQAS
ncbi:phage antirepressor KilAC domain-containing protein [Heliobacterium chlorum]|uniref:Phage antirepressor KilAC domain-containing protein n=1 Tax=Heliobacterium chlorum TaxID=2698 RepID=A0ABR7T7A9_HELCL|nr:phage antirepressor KilAC domain-containing protein [Heliobacterium chlorum]MBC9786511.1 phage antirepressor KilAC domain-containing protein [Heliobacterium chlorum]